MAPFDSSHTSSFWCSIVTQTDMDGRIDTARLHRPRFWRGKLVGCGCHGDPVYQISTFCTFRFFVRSYVLPYDVMNNNNNNNNKRTLKRLPTDGAQCVIRPPMKGSAYAKMRRLELRADDISQYESDSFTRKIGVNFPSATGCDVCSDAKDAHDQNRHISTRCYTLGNRHARGSTAPAHRDLPRVTWIIRRNANERRDHQSAIVSTDD